MQLDIIAQETAEKDGETQEHIALCGCGKHGDIWLSGTAECPSCHTRPVRPLSLNGHVTIPVAVWETLGRNWVESSEELEAMRDETEDLKEEIARLRMALGTHKITA